MRRVLKWLSACAAVSIALLVALYAAFPWCIQKLAPLIAQRIGAEQLSIVASRPDWDGLNIARIDMTRDTMHLQATDTRVRYSLSQLLRGHVGQIGIAQVDVSLRSQSGVAVNEAATAPRLPTLPVDILSVKTLIVRLPDTGFVGVGEATLAQSGLRFSMLGEQPDAASKLRIDATLTRQGVFDAKIGERDTATDHFVALSGVLGDDAMVVDGAIDLTGFPLALVSEIAGLPQGAGHVAARIETTLPWPLPDSLAWETLHGDIANLSVDWAHSDLRVRLDEVRGRASFAGGRVALNVGGTATYQTDEGVLRAVAPPDYAARFADGVLEGGPDLSVVSRAGEQTIAAVVSKFSLGFVPDLTANVEADIDVAIGANSATAQVLTNFELKPRDGRGPRMFGASLRLANDPAVEVAGVSGTLAADALILDGRFELRADALTAVSALIGIPQGEGAVAGRVHSDLALPYVAADAVYNLSELDINWRSSDDVLRANAIRGVARLQGAAVDAKLGGTIDYQFGERLVRLRVPERYPVRYNGTSLSSAAGLKVSSSRGAERVDATIRSLSVTPASESTIEVSADVDGAMGDSRARGVLNALLKSRAGDRAKLEGRIDFDGVIDAANQTRNVQLTSALTLKGADLHADGSLTTPGLGALAFDARIDTRTSSGRLDVAKTFEFFGPAASLFLPDWDAAYDVDGGRVDAKFALQWETPERIAGDVSLDLGDVAAHYDTFLFEGVSGVLRLSTANVTQPDAWQLHPSRVVIANIDVGLPLTDVTLDVSWSGNQVLVPSGTASLLGGALTTSAIDYKLDSGTAVFDVLLQGLDLADVLALEGKNITGTGRLDGTLPVQLANNQPSVKGGSVRAREPGGTIALASPLADDSGQAELSFALTALKDFRYSSLVARVDYASNGDLDLGVALQGRNPAVEKNRPIHYNLNITENIPVLLKSLRLKDRLNDDIEGRFND